MNTALKSWCNEIKIGKITEESQSGIEGDSEGENKKEKKCCVIIVDSALIEQTHQDHTVLTLSSVCIYPAITHC